MKAVLGASAVLFLAGSIATGQTSGSFLPSSAPLDWRSTSTPTTPTPGSGNASTLVWYADRSTFSNSVPGLCNKEDFESSPVAPGGVIGCNEPIWSCSNDGCFVPGDVEGGLSLSSSDNGGVVVLGTGFFGVGNPSNVVCGNTFVAWTNLNFCNSPTGVCFEVFSNAGVSPDAVEVRVLDCKNNLMGSQVFNVPAGTGSAFVGVETTGGMPPIWRIEVESLSGSGECIDDVVFNGHCDPILSADKKHVVTGDTISLGITEGLPNSRALLYITCVNGGPFNLRLPPPLGLPAGIVCLPSAVVPPAPANTSVGLTAFVITPGVGVKATNKKTLFINVQ